jgi:predicted NBD/HSP70 family sugar kinase
MPIVAPGAAVLQPASPVLPLREPRLIPELDPGFRPAALANRQFREDVAATGSGVPLVIGLERPDGSRSRFETRVFGPSHPRFRSSLPYAERIFKFLLWQRGGCKASVGGPREIADHLRSAYSASGARAFDCHFLGDEVYGSRFTIDHCDPFDVPEAAEVGRPLGRHLDGCRVGFDLGASDRKASAVVDGEAIYSEEVAWSPGTESNPEYHFREIMTALKTAASKMPRLDAIGGSSAGIYVNDTVRVASLFRGVPKADYEQVRTLFHRIREELGVPLAIVNDGEVAALAGSMSLGDHSVLGIALGSSEAAGYVNAEGNITGWLNELAFAPVDYRPGAPADEWSGDVGVGSQYFSQQCVCRLAPKAGIELPAHALPAEKLALVQHRLEAGDEAAARIWRTMGVYLGYAVAHYADFYPLRHVLILGRCTSGRGGRILLDEAKRVLSAEFPIAAVSVKIQLPNEKSRRVGQSVAAASLPSTAGGCGVGI